jgi:sodium transport system permease protein
VLVNFREIAVLYRCELRGALRERSILVFSVLLPILLYPVLMWAMLTGMTFVIGTTEGMISRIVVLGLSDAHQELGQRLSDHDLVEVDEQVTSVEAATEMIREGNLDALIEILPVTGEAAAVADNYQVRLSFDGSKDRSEAARKRIDGLLDAYRSDWLHGQAEALGVSEVDWGQLQIVRHSISSEEEMGAFIMGLMLPLFLIIMVAMGCFHPAIDATAGERERNTWETVMTTGASRHSIVIAKYLYVATMGTVAGLLNLTAMLASMESIFAPMLERADESLTFTLPLAAIPVMAIGTILVAMFAAAGMMIFASFARSFKEGQALITPFYLLLFVPVLLLQSPDLKLTPVLACIPVANLLMVFREAIMGIFNLPLIGLSAAVEVATIYLCLRLAALILSHEDVVTGSFEGNLQAFIRNRLFGKKTALRSEQS